MKAFRFLVVVALAGWVVWLAPSKATTSNGERRCLEWMDGAVKVVWCTEVSENVMSSVDGAVRWWRVWGSNTRDGRGVAGDKLTATVWGPDWFADPDTCVAFTGPDGVAVCDVRLNLGMGMDYKMSVGIGTMFEYYQPRVYRKYLPMAIAGN